MSSIPELIDLKSQIDELLNENNKLIEKMKAKTDELDSLLVLEGFSAKIIKSTFNEAKKINSQIFKNEKEIKKIQREINKLEKGIGKEAVRINAMKIIEDNIHLYKIIEDVFEKESIKYQEKMIILKREFETFLSNGGTLASWERINGSFLTTLLYKSEESIKKECHDEVMYSFYDLVLRVKNSAGKAIDFSLQGNQKGGVDGWIKGDVAKVTINTVPAGGYNIQRFHFRTLIHTIEKY